MTPFLIIKKHCIIKKYFCQLIIFIIYENVYQNKFHKN
ncbi:hypothetical protein CSU_1390 [Campylobacter jejuni subsp. jejuni 327]|nr:hypothetical protein CSU_1390 [Campylobacter jejuni subsp. jejuni 327]ENI12518.1 hypothetical protein H840_0957 [Campylobacter jejuni subsp. jejuni ICDCCJ07002]ENI13374.1 hypothetical protein H741_0640 [Campylobacter jejuni subsp. jejuni ICDCCJ07004]KUY35373.1 hypothetical protein K691_0019 [Campylobacter jejuni HB-CJGB-XWM]